MKVKYLFSKTKKSLFLFSLFAFLTLSIFSCHPTVVQAATPSGQKLVSKSQILHQDVQYSQQHCQSKRKTIINQNESSMVNIGEAGNRGQQKSILYLAFGILPNNFSLNKQRQGPLFSSDNLLAARTSQILSIVKIE